MNKILKFRNVPVKNTGKRLSTLDPHDQKVLERHIQKLNKADEILYKLYRNEFECNKNKEEHNINEERLEEAFIISSLARAELKLKLHLICKKQETSR